MNALVLVPQATSAQLDPQVGQLKCVDVPIIFVQLAQGSLNWLITHSILYQNLLISIGEQIRDYANLPTIATMALGQHVLLVLSEIHQGWFMQIALMFVP